MWVRRVDGLSLDTTDDLAFSLVMDVMDRYWRSDWDADSWTWYRVNSQDEDAVTGLVAALAEHGVVLLDGVTSGDDLLRLAHSIATIVPHRDSDAAGLHS